MIAIISWARALWRAAATSSPSTRHILHAVRWTRQPAGGISNLSRTAKRVFDMLPGLNPVACSCGYSRINLPAECAQIRFRDLEYRLQKINRLAVCAEEIACAQVRLTVPRWACIRQCQ